MDWKCYNNIIFNSLGARNRVGEGATMNNFYKVSSVLLVAVLISARANPIMVSFGTRMAPIVPPTPRPRLPVTYPLIPPAPVYEDPEPENNSVYNVPLRYGFRLKPFLKSYERPINYKYYY